MYSQASKSRNKICKEKREWWEKGQRSSIPLLHEMFILLYPGEDLLCLSDPSTQSISSCFLRFLLWRSHGDIVFHAALQRFSVFLLRSHTLQDFKVVCVPRFSLLLPNLFISYNPQLFCSQCLDWGIILCFWVTLEEIIKKQTPEWYEPKTGTIQDGIDGSFWGTSEANVLDVKRLTKNFLFWVLWS